MANALYRKGAEGFLKGTVSWTNNNIRMLLLNDQYDPDLTNDVYVSDIPTQAQVATSTNLTSKLATNGYALSDAVKFSQLYSLNKVVAVVLFKWTGSNSSSNLLAYFDDSTGLPFKPTGRNYYVLYDLIFGGYFKF